MFSCFRRCFGSGHQRPKRPGRFQRVLRSIYRHLCPFSCTENQDNQNLEDGKIFDPKDPEYMKYTIDLIPQAIKDGNSMFIYIVSSILPNVFTTWEILEMMMDRYGPLQPDRVEDQEKMAGMVPETSRAGGEKQKSPLVSLVLRNTGFDGSALLSLLSILRTEYPQDFRSPDPVVAKRLEKYLWPNEPARDFILQGEELEEQESKMDNEVLREINPEAPIQDASGMAETLHLGPTSVAGPQGFLKTQGDTDLAVGEPTVPEAGPVPLQTSDQPLPTDAQSPLEVAADDPDDRKLFLISVVQLGAPEPVFPLPDVDT